MRERDGSLSRRVFLRGTIAATSLLVSPACSNEVTPKPMGSPAGGPAPGAAPRDDAGSTKEAGTDAGPAPTPTCDENTEDDALGPYYKPGAPTRTSLVEPGMAGTVLTITGSVSTAAAGACAPLAGAVLDLWQANDAGAYDNTGFTLRGKFVADAQGRYRIETIVPGHYLNGASYRPRHLHVTVTAASRAPLTTQLYFAGDPYNATDGGFRPSLLLVPAGDGAARFDFVLA